MTADAAELAPLRAAATLLLISDRAESAPEVLMIQRAAAMAFAGGAWVFPGGRVDAADRPTMLDEQDEERLADTMARVAVIRETIEEVGIAIGIVPVPDGDALPALRAGLARGEAFQALLTGGGFSLDLEAVVPFARWFPAHAAPRRFDTRFYLAQAFKGAEVVPDGGESIAARWIAPAEALALGKARQMPIIFPTRCNLIRLAQFGSYAEMVASARSIPVERVNAFIEERDGVAFICIAEGQGYPAVSQRFSGAQAGQSAPG